VRMSEGIRISIPIEPMPLDRARSSSRLEFDPVSLTKKYKTRFHNTKRNASYKHALKAFVRSRYPMKPIEAPVQVLAIFYLRKPENKKKGCRLPLPTCTPDLDNLVKALFDALNKVVWRDDAQVVQLTCQKLWALPNEAPRTELIVREFECVRDRIKKEL